MKYSLNKNELRYLMKKFGIPEEAVTELEQKHHGKEKLPDRIYDAMLLWKDFRGSEVTSDMLIRVLGIIGHKALSGKLNDMKIMSQRLRF